MNDDNQITFGKSGEMQKPDSVESELTKYGVEADETPRDTQIDRPEPETFGEFVDVGGEPDAGEQSELIGEVDEKQQDLTGKSGVEKPAEWDIGGF